MTESDKRAKSLLLLYLLKYCYTKWQRHNRGFEPVFGKKYEELRTATAKETMELLDSNKLSVLLAAVSRGFCFFFCLFETIIEGDVCDTAYTVDDLWATNNLLKELTISKGYETYDAYWLPLHLKKDRELIVDEAIKLLEDV